MLAELYRLRDAAGPQMREAINTQIRALEDSGVEMDQTAGRAENLRDRVNDIPKYTRINVEADIGPAETTLSNFIARRWTAIIQSQVEGSGTSGSGGPNRRLAGGGRVRGPGTGTSDSVLGLDAFTGAPTAWVSNGEFVTNERQYRRNRGLVEAINAGMVPAGVDPAALRYLATGGPVMRDKIAVRYDVDLRSAEDAITRLRRAVGASLGDPRGPVTPNGVRGLGPAAARAHQFVRSNWGFQGTMGGYANRNIAGTNVKSKHALGKAIDVMTYSNMALGQSIADFFAGPGRRQFGVDNVIWNRRIHSGRGWGAYRGVSPHTDHPHIDFYKTGTPYVPHDGPAILHRGERVMSREQNMAYTRSREFSGSGLGPGGLTVVVQAPLSAASTDRPRDERREPVR